MITSFRGHKLIKARKREKDDKKELIEVDPDAEDKAVSIP